MTGKHTRRGDGPARPIGAPAAPAGPRRPTPGAGSVGQRVPGKGENRPSPSLVHKWESSTPDLKLRYDDIGRGFLYAPLKASPYVPEAMTGARATSALTLNAVRQIKGAAIKAHILGLGLQTFVTFTLRPGDREAIASGDLVLGREIRRTLNAMQEKFRRLGFSDFAYIWVAENPHNENPHIHLPTNHQVPRSEFLEFAAWVESLWGHGFAKIERIRDAERAGRYLLKAVGYSAKGTDGSQGIVYGNRYGISRNIRPQYETLNLNDEEEAAEGLLELIRTMEPAAECEQLGRLWLTRHGLSFPAGTTLEEIGKTLDVIKGAVVRE